MGRQASGARPPLAGGPWSRRAGSRAALGSPILPLPVGPSPWALPCKQQLERGGLLSVATPPATVCDGQLQAAGGCFCARFFLRKLGRCWLALAHTPARRAMSGRCCR